MKILNIKTNLGLNESSNLNDSLAPVEGSVVMSRLMDIVVRVRQLSKQHIACLSRLKHQSNGGISKNKVASFINELPGLYRELFGIDCL